jgi:hypothetical protein
VALHPGRDPVRDLDHRILQWTRTLVWVVRSAD